MPILTTNLINNIINNHNNENEIIYKLFEIFVNTKLNTNNIKEVKNLFHKRVRDYLFKSHPCLYVLETIKETEKINKIYIRYFRNLHPVQIKDYHNLLINNLENKHKTKLKLIKNINDLENDKIGYKSFVIFLDTLFLKKSINEKNINDYFNHWETTVITNKIITKNKDINTITIKDDNNIISKELLDSILKNKKFILKHDYLDILFKIILTYYYLYKSLPFDRMLILCSSDIDKIYDTRLLFNFLSISNYNLLIKSNIIKLSSYLFYYLVKNNTYSIIDVFMVDKNKLEKENIKEILYFTDDILDKSYIDTYHNLLDSLKNTSFFNDSKLYVIYEVMKLINDKTNFDLISYMGKFNLEDILGVINITNKLKYFKEDKNFIQYLIRNKVQVKVIDEDELKKQYVNYLINSINNLFCYKLKRNIVENKVKDFINNLSENKLTRFIKKYGSIKKKKIQKLLKEMYNTFDHDKNVLYNIFETFLDDVLLDKWSFIDKDNYNNMIDNIKEISKFKVLKKLFPATLNIHILNDLIKEKLVPILEKDYYIGKQIVNTLSKFVFCKENYIHDLLFFIDIEDDGEIYPLNKIIKYYTQLSPKSHTRTEEISSIRKLYNFYKNNKDMEHDIDKLLIDVNNISKLPKVINDIRKIINKDKIVKIEKFLDDIKLKDTNIYQSIKEKFILNLLDMPNYIEINFNQKKCLFIDDEYKLNDVIKVYFRSWNSILSCYAPDAVDCCAGIESKKFRNYANHRYTYNLILVDNNKEKIILWSLLTLIHDNEDNIYLLLDNIEALKNKEYKNLIQRNLNKLFKIIFNYIDKLNYVNKEIFFIGIKYNDIDLSKFKTIPNHNLELIVPLTYSDAFGELISYIIKIDRK